MNNSIIKKAIPVDELKLDNLPNKSQL